jgi:putative glutamine amidotransferase
MGGSLHQSVHEVSGLNDHREDQQTELAEQYGDVHAVTLTEAGMLARITGCKTMQVNSLHSQGINRLGDGLLVEAVADDGLVEAVRIESMQFGLAVQWHPEWQVMENPKQKRLFEAFGEACRKR